MSQTTAYISRRNYKNLNTGVPASILRTLCYFDIFNFPLTKKEILLFLDRNINEDLLESNIHTLLQQHSIFLHQGHYMIQDNPLLVTRRVIGNQQAARLLEKAFRIGRFLYRFPFVRGVGISGSLSKGFADEKADIDFFIITKANRLWISRSLMHLFKKLTFLTGRQHYYCMNYYIDEDALALENQNIFTAVELKTLYPVAGIDTLGRFFQANTWADEFLPGCKHRHQKTPDRKTGFLKRFIEWSLDNKTGARIDNLLHNLTSRRWKTKKDERRRNSKGQTMGLITGKHFSRSNPGDFQERVLRLYDEKLRKMGMPSPNH